LFIVVETFITLTKLKSAFIKTKSNEIEILISSVYKPPKGVLNVNDLNILMSSSNLSIAVGDFNAEHLL